jgi:hypothetical protein
MKNMLFLFFLITTSTLTLAGEALETSSFAEIEKKALTLGKKHGPKNVLVVLDIDNTILAMPQELGSDQWFTWQYDDCIKKDAKQAHCSAKNMGELLDLQGKLFSLSNMVTTEAAAPRVVKNLQKKGFKVMLLTSRGPNYRNSTERELKKNGYNMIDSSIGPKGGYAGTFIPYTLDNLKASGITKDEAAVAKLRKARKISYMNGVMMTSGLNKGIMLKSILHKTNSTFKGIVFADDHIKHTTRMQAILGNKKGIDLVTYRYGKIDPQVNAFKASDKKDVTKAFNTYKKTIGSVFK